MNVKRFTARTSREALMLVRQAFGDDAVVVSTRPCPEGVEVLAMAPESVQQFERMASPGNPAPAPAAVRPAARQTARGALPAPVAAPTVDDDVEQLAMSTLSFQDYVRERMLKRRDAELQAQDPKPLRPHRPGLRSHVPPPPGLPPQPRPLPPRQPSTQPPTRPRRQQQPLPRRHAVSRLCCASR